METKHYALIEWEDNHTSIIDVVTIISPRKEVHRYEEGEKIQAKFRGTVYKAVISNISEDRKYLEDLRKNDTLKHRFCTSEDREEASAPTHKNVRITPKKVPKPSPPSSTPKKASAPTFPQNVRVSPKKRDKIPPPSSTSKKVPTSTSHQNKRTVTPKKIQNPSSSSSTPNKALTPTSHQNKRTVTPKKIQKPSSSSSTPNKLPTPTSHQNKRTVTPKKIQKPSSSSAAPNKDANNDSEDFTSFQRDMEQSMKKSREKRKLDRLSNEVESMKKEVKKLKKRVKELEKTTTSTNETDQLSEQDLTKRQLRNNIQGMFNASQAVSFLLKHLFTADEIKNSSLSGKKTVKCGEGGPRPPLDQDKLRIMEEIIYEKFPSFSRKDLREKVQNIQKVERRRKNAIDEN